MHGADIAWRYVQYHDIPKGDTEINLESGNLGAIHDLVYADVEGDEDWSVDVVVTRDYKTSWQTSVDDLKTLQRKIQAITLADTYPDAHALRLEVVNLRTGWTFKRLLVLDDDGRRELDEWRAEVQTLCQAADKAADTPVASPGGGCIDCPWALQCEASIKAMTDAESVAERIAVATAQRDAAIKVGKQLFADAPVQVGGGKAVGFFEQSTRTLPEENALDLFAKFAQVEPDHNVLRVIYPEKADREKAAELLFDESQSAQFKVKKA